MTSAPLLLEELEFLMLAQLRCSASVFGVCFWVGWALPSCPPRGFKDRSRSSLPKPRGAQCHDRAQCNVCAARTHPTGLHCRCHHTALHSGLGSLWSLAAAQWKEATGLRACALPSLLGLSPGVSGSASRGLAAGTDPCHVAVPVLGAIPGPSCVCPGTCWTGLRKPHGPSRKMG